MYKHKNKKANNAATSLSNTGYDLCFYIYIFPRGCKPDSLNPPLHKNNLPLYIIYRPAA
jgi:hypothetical protein